MISNAGAPSALSSAVESVSAGSRVLSLNARLYLLMDIATGMEFLHKRNMLHRDLKTSNILVHYESEQARFLAKVCDFGSSRHAQSYSNNDNLSSSKNDDNGHKRDLSLTNYKNAAQQKQRLKAALQSKQKSKKRQIPQILANMRKLKLNNQSKQVGSYSLKNQIKGNPFHPRTASITEESNFEPSASVTDFEDTSTRFGRDMTYGDREETQNTTYGTEEPNTSTTTKWKKSQACLMFIFAQKLHQKIIKSSGFVA